MIVSLSVFYCVAIDLSSIAQYRPANYSYLNTLNYGIGPKKI